MPDYVAFLRAINLGARRKFAKEAVTAATEAAGGTNVASWLNTGNVRLTSSRRSVAAVRKDLEKAYEEAAGFAVPTVVLTLDQLAELATETTQIAASAADLGAHYVSLLQQTPDPQTAADFAQRWDGDEWAVVTEKAVHILLSARDGYHSSRLTNDQVERTFGTATSRNARVITTVAQKWT